MGAQNKKATELLITTISGFAIYYYTTEVQQANRLNVTCITKNNSGVCKTDEHTWSSHQL